jgi:AcrR family transcriptional regulator
VDVRRRILDAAIEVLAASGFDGASLSEVAARAGVSRPTVYRHFGSREQLVSAALLRLSEEIVQRVWAAAGQATTAAELVVEATIRARYEFRTQPALAPIAFPESGSFGLARASLSTDAVSLATRFLAPLLDHQPELADEMDEIAETVIRFLLSLVWFDGDAGMDDDRLRGYLHRRMVPALGIRPVADHSAQSAVLRARG